MLSKEQVLEIISYCDTHGVTRRSRLMELGITHWEFYKSRRRHLEAEKSRSQETSGSFIQLKTNFAIRARPYAYKRITEFNNNSYIGFKKVYGNHCWRKVWSFYSEIGMMICEFQPIEIDF